MLFALPSFLERVVENRRRCIYQIRKSELGLEQPGFSMEFSRGGKDS
jgi:hypothetical protein